VAPLEPVVPVTEAPVNSRPLKVSVAGDWTSKRRLWPSSEMTAGVPPPGIVYSTVVSFVTTISDAPMSMLTGALHALRSMVPPASAAAMKPSGVQYAGGDAPAPGAAATALPRPSPPAASTTANSCRLPTTRLGIATSLPSPTEACISTTLHFAQRG
jgi:hypothetical protein